MRTHSDEGKRNAALIDLYGLLARTLPPHLK
jgi:hypothetical protein